MQTQPPTPKIKINVFSFQSILGNFKNMFFSVKNISLWVLDIQSLFYLLMKLFQKYIYILEFKREQNIYLQAVF